MIFNIDDTIYFSNRHKGETIREISEYDSGYLKDLFLKDSRLVFSNDCFKFLQEKTKGHKDTFNPIYGTNNIFDTLKKYATPYLYDFNNKEIEKQNEQRLSELI